MKEKISSLLKRTSLLLVAMLMMFHFSSIDVFASSLSAEDIKTFIQNAGGGANVDSTHTNSSAGNQKISNGVSSSRTGMMAYLVDMQGNVVSEAIAFKSPGFDYCPDITGSGLPVKWVATARKGGVSVSDFTHGEVPWGCAPWTANGSSVTSNEPQIKAWFKEKSPKGVDNSLNFVDTYFGTDKAHKFGQGEYVIVLETLMHFQFSYSGGTESSGLSDEEKNQIRDRLTSTLVLLNATNVEVIKSILRQYGLGYKVYQIEQSDAQTQRVAWPAMKSQLQSALRNELSKLQNLGTSTDSASGRDMIEPRLVGTVPQLVKFKSSLNPESKVFDSYINESACLAEYIKVGDIGEKVGFVAHSGGSKRFSNAEVQSLGVAMMVISCADPGQTTYDESQGETPAPPADESDGKYTIIKSYRKKIGETKYEDEGTFHIKDIASEITIENEKSHKVVEWRISTTENTGISSLTWESSVPPSVSESGKNPTTVKLEDPEKVLYVLLERTEEEEPEEKEYNYLITESTITRRVKMSEPDNKLSMPDILNHTFKWVLPAHKTTCSGHTWSAPCDSSHTRTVKVSDGCPSTCTEVHEHKGAEYGTENYNCGQNCKTQTAYCSGWDWKNKDLKLSLHNSKQQSSPDILAIKTSPKNWFYNPNTNISKLVQGFYRDNNTFDREATSQQIYENKNWDYICVIHRGQDKLNLAEWINNGQGQYDPTEATTNLQGVNKEVYQASNKSSGQRKQNGFYTETFQVSIGRQEHGVEQTDNETIYAPTIPSSVPGQSLLSSSAICPDDQRQATLTPLSFNVIVRVEVYKGLDTTEKHDGFEDGHTSKPRGDYSIVSGRMIKGSNISFIPYILMKYDTIDEATTDEPAYVMGEYTRDMSLLHYGEIAWNKSSNPNLLSYYNYILLNTATPKGVFLLFKKEKLPHCH